MTCVLGMVVRRERETREFVKLRLPCPQYRRSEWAEAGEGEWKAVEGSKSIMRLCFFTKRKWIQEKKKPRRN